MKFLRSWRCAPASDLLFVILFDIIGSQCYILSMLNQSNKNVPTRRVNFYSFKAEITRRLKENHSELQSYTHVGTSEIHPLELEIPERIALLGYEDYSPWEVTDFRLTHVWEDSTDQFVY